MPEDHKAPIRREQDKAATAKDQIDPEVLETTAGAQ